MLTYKKIRGFFLAFLFFYAILMAFSLSLLSKKSNDIAVHSTENACKPPKFLLLIGLEGTGHHLWQSLVAASPAFQGLQDKGIDITQLQQVLFDNEHREKSLWGFPTANVAGNATQLLETVTYVLRYFDRMSHYTIAINGAELPSFNFGAMSYPTFAWNQVLNYPDIGLLYKACDLANVTCQHVYLSRDPYSVVRSTVRRSFHSLQLTPHLFSTMLAVIYKQLAENPGRTAACWQFEDRDDAWKIGKLLGWKDKSEFEREFNAIYKPPYARNSRSQIPSSIIPYMDSMEQSSNLVMNFCKQVENQCE